MKIPLPYNDTRRIQLLKRLENKDKKQVSELDKLTKAYPTYVTSEDTICMELSNYGFLVHHGKPGYTDENGFYQQVEEFDNNKYSTTLEGIEALKFSFPSELQSQSKSELFKQIELYGILIAAAGGLITIISFFSKQIQSLFNN